MTFKPDPNLSRLCQALLKTGSETSCYPHFPLANLTVLVSYIRALVISTLIEKRADVNKVKPNWVWYLHTLSHEASLELLSVIRKTQNILLNDAVSVSSS